MKQRTLAIIKPDAVGRNIIGEIICMAQERELVPVAAKLIRLSRERAQNFYSIHRDKEFFDGDRSHGYGGESRSRSPCDVGSD